MEHKALCPQSCCKETTMDKIRIHGYRARGRYSSMCGTKKCRTCVQWISPLLKAIGLRLDCARSDAESSRHNVNAVAASPVMARARALSITRSNHLPRSRVGWSDGIVHAGGPNRTGEPWHLVS